MAQVIWTVLAQYDLQDIYEYISKDSELYAIRVVDKIIERVDLLNKQAQAGKVVAEYNNEAIRELIEGMYRIIYQIEAEDKITILRVYHGARLLK